MISLIEARNFRCLRYIRQPLGPFHVLVGPNASGKTTFLDVPAFLGRLVSDGLDAAINERTQNFQDLLWQRSGDEFELAIEANIPEEYRASLKNDKLAVVRYEVALGLDDESDEFVFRAEKLMLKPVDQPHAEPIQDVFPYAPDPPKSIITTRAKKGTKTVVSKVPTGNDTFHSEVGKGWAPAYKLGPRKSALGNLPEDETKFPIATWLKRLLSDGVQKLMLNSLLLRKASPPGQGPGFKTDGSNLPWVVEDLIRKNPDQVGAWVQHLQTALPDLEAIRTVERSDDKHRYLMLKYRGGLEVPSWMVSDGTLRLLALTLPAYLPNLGGVYLIEEPENGIHPRAVETMFQSLSSVYDAQIILATHSPVILSMVDVENVLCFAKTEKGAVDIVRGDEHPALREWHGETNLGLLFAGGVLG